MATSYILSSSSSLKYFSSGFLSMIIYDYDEEYLMMVISAFPETVKIHLPYVVDPRITLP